MNCLIHNRIWEARYRVWCQYAGGGWWGRGSVISPEMRGIYEKYLPFDEFRHSLVTIGEQCLETPDWVPAILRSHDILSLPDFWAMLPDAFAGRVTFRPEEFLPLFCAVADPSRFGTADHRYPRQLQKIKDFLNRKKANGPLRLLDLGCGIGLGTCELAMLVAETGGSAVGVTSDHLEVWMAQHRRLPHDPCRERLFRRYPAALPVRFVHGRAESYQDSTHYDVIVCNGLAGGRFLNDRTRLAAFLDNCSQLLAPDGKLFIANHFHDGERPGVNLLCHLARQRQWSVSGSWNDLTLIDGPFPKYQSSTT